VAQRRISVYVALVSMFSALTAALTYLVRVPSPTGGYTHIGDTIIYLAALLFGPSVGVAVGILGPLAADLLAGYPRRYVSIVAHGVQGYLAGLGRGRRFRAQAMLLVAAGLAMSFTYFAVNVYIKGVALATASLIRDVFGQSLVSWILSLLLVKPLEKNPVVQKAASMV
jgi:uncharacterized membrane protein